jgi:NAD-dependent dihydropyrimidine dehydrogenase PreA subunit
MGKSIGAVGMPVFVDPRICENQQICELMKVCPRNAIYQDKKGSIEIDNDKCTECMLCVKACPYLAVKLAKDKDELEDLIRKSKKVKLSRNAHLAKIYGSRPGRMGKTELKDSNFKKKVGSKTPTLVNFWGAHSGVIAPFLKSIEKDYKGRLGVAYIKVADNPKSQKKYSITSTPTLIIFKKGKEIGRLEGIRPKDTLRVWLEMKLKPKT